MIGSYGCDTSDRLHSVKKSQKVVQDAPLLTLNFYLGITLWVLGWVGDSFLDDRSCTVRVLTGSLTRIRTWAHASLSDGFWPLK